MNINDKNIISKLNNRKILKNFSWTLMAKLIAMIFFFAIDISIARLLGVLNYAEWTFFYATLTMMFYFVWFGINASVKVFVSKQKNVSDRDTCIRAGLLLRTMVSLVFCIVILMIAEPLSLILGYPDKYAHLPTLFRCASFIVFFNSFSEFYKELNIGLQYYRNVFWVTFAEYGGNLFFGFIGAYIVGSAVGVAYGYILSGVVVWVVGWRILKQKIGYRKSENTTRYYSLLKEIFRYAIPLAIINIGGMVLVEMDTFMLGIMSTEQETAMYAIAKQLCSKATHVNYALATATLTEFSILEKQFFQKKKQFFKISRINILIAIVIGIGFLLVGPFAIRLLYGGDYYYAGTILRWLVPYYILYSLSNFFSLFLDFQRKAVVRSICYCSVLVINLGLNLLLIPKLGAVGASIATAISLIPYTIMVTVISVFQFRKREINNKLAEKNYKK